MKSKSERYLELVAKFKNYAFKDARLINPHQIEGFNYNVINPWEIWHNNLDAKILFIGQDFSDTTSLIKHLKTDWAKEKTSPTNNNLMDLFTVLGHPYSIHEIDYINKIKRTPLFFTNAILGIKVTDTENMGLPVKDEWWKETCNEYLKELIDIVQPKHIIAMSMMAYKAVSKIYDNPVEKSVYAAIANNGKRKVNDMDLFVVSHCSPNGLMKRKMKIQIQDWLKIRNYMEGIYDEEIESSISSIN